MWRNFGLLALALALAFRGEERKREEMKQERARTPGSIFSVVDRAHRPTIRASKVNRYEREPWAMLRRSGADIMDFGCCVGWHLFWEGGEEGYFSRIRGVGSDGVPLRRSAWSILISWMERKKRANALEI